MGVVSVRSRGMRSVRVVGSSYALSVSSSSARASLSRRRARLRGLRSSASTRSFLPTINPACTPPSSLSPEKVTRSTPVASVARTVGSSGRPRTREVDQGAAAQVHAGGNLVLAADGRKLTRGHLAGEALDVVVARMHLQQQGGRGRDGLEIARMGAVGGAHLGQLAAGPLHDFRQSEAAADLDQFASGNGHFAPERQGVEHQEDRGGVVVDHGCGLGAGEQLQSMPDDALSLASAALGKVVLEGRGTGGLGDGSGHRLWAQEGAAEVSVNDGAGEVEHGLVAVAHFRAQPVFEGVGIAARLRSPIGDSRRRSSAPPARRAPPRWWWRGPTSALPLGWLRGSAPDRHWAVGATWRHSITAWPVVRFAPPLGDRA